MRTLFVALPLILTTVACTHGAVSSIPQEIQGVGTVYRYQGRANFSHQIAEADKLITDHCLSVNGGKPVVVDLQKRDLGMEIFNSGSSSTTFNGTFTGSQNQANVYGRANRSSMESASALRNMNQEILYKCVKN